MGYFVACSYNKQLCLARGVFGIFRGGIFGLREECGLYTDAEYAGLVEAARIEIKKIVYSSPAVFYRFVTLH